MSNYQPKPLQTDAVILPAQLETLRELLARNVHENWAADRMRQGWTYGTQRDDTRKQHPCLVPYDQLPEPEKDYDRRTAMETLRAILLLGYEIRPPQSR